MWLIACICGLILTLCLFLRPTPYDTAYVMDNLKYMPHAIFYMTYGLALIAFPFMAVSLIIKDGPNSRLRHKVCEGICAVLLSLSLLYEHIDNEILRYCNMHISPDFLRTYVLSDGVPVALWDMLATDPGGSNVSLILLGVPVVFLLTWIFLGRRIPCPQRVGRGAQWIGLALVFIVCVFLPAFLRTDLFGSKNRQAKVAPPAVLMLDIVTTWSTGTAFPDDMPARLSAAQTEWQSTNHDAHWVMPDASKPGLRHYDGTCPAVDKPYNVLLVVFESFRAHSLTKFNPHETVEATPWLNQFIETRNAAYYPFYYTNAHPTVAAFMALHTGLLPHNAKTVAKAYTSNNLGSFVDTMRHHGYEAAYFGASDPDWDNQRPWLMRWYDSVSFKPENDELDRNVMHDLANWLKTERDTTKPFIATTFLISNHMPFHLREEALRLNDSDELKDKIYNTMHYDDDVLREFIESIEHEPWYENTLVILTGDHGMDLGDRGDAPDYNNLRTEAVHIPLVIAGNHPRLPKGRQTQRGSHIDLGATVLDLVGICDDTTSQGHSLLDLDEQRPVYAIKYGRSSIYTRDWSAYALEDGSVMLFEASDDLQQNDVSQNHPDVAQALKQQMDDMAVVVNYSYTHHLTDM